MEICDYSFVVVGSGLLGAVIAERIANCLNKPVLVIEKRNHIGGNCYSETDAETQIEYHKYGTHIFHTSNERVWKYVNQFTTFNAYRHQVLACYKDKIYQLPINLETINSFFNVNLKPYQVDKFMAERTSLQTHQPGNFEEKAISLLGKELYEAFIKGYTLKQWQIDPCQLPASIFNRLPFRKNYDENYFFDNWQGIPKDGYTAMFERMLSNKKIHVLLNTDFFDVRDQLKKDACLVYSGPIDRFFNYKYGKLSWRTLRFEQEVIEVEDYQGNSVINFPEIEIPYTRIHEPKHLHPERDYTREKTVIFKEYSLKDNGSDPFYPISSADNIKIFDRYKEEASQLPNVFISGRLGDYKYYDMHQTIARALEIFEIGILPKNPLA
ncbi:UDP-galactopyranose mutase [Longitalea luteola]|uniref:UDP-galactopyranose mutase n=1 Tax=Longitalea luteola TaxID=2812563 RepID=UPI001A972027|nr:UDP-galactopyranose mutase [Longitalea luteola]